ncbi:MAG: LysR substrate-binding domain-containing protein, partial [Sneathiellales bacterium]|nr:LysR substrate-binding domain-containing protein [Sneathiellales bacterium]
LLDRRNRRVYLTEKGTYFADQVNRQLQDLEKTCEHLFALENSKRISLSCEPSLAMRWLIPRLHDFYRKFPDIDIQLSTAGGAVDLAKQKIDLAIRRTDFQWPRDYHVTLLFSERIGPVCHPDYWEKRHSGKVSLLHTRTRPSAWSDWQALAKRKVDVSSESFFDHFYFSLQAAVAGLGVAIGPESHVADDLAKGHLIAPFGFLDTDVNYVALSLKNIKNDPVTALFVKWLKEQIPEEQDSILQDR